MNRKERRQNNKFNANEVLNKPCTLTEVVQVSRGVVQDELDNYARRTSPLQVSMSLQIEILKSLVIKSGLITEEEFKKIYIEKAEEFNQRQKEMLGDMFEGDDNIEEEEEIPGVTGMNSNVVSLDVTKG